MRFFPSAFVSSPFSRIKASLVWSTVLLCCFGACAQAQTAHFNGITTTLGSGFSYPSGVTVDGTGNVYVADTNNHAVKKIPYSGGSYGTPVTLGSGFNSPSGVAVDYAGNVYVADADNIAVEKIPHSGGSYGTPVTLGSGFNGPFGVAVDGAGNVYVADYSNNAVKKIPYSGGSYGTPVTLGSGFSYPTGVAVDGMGNVYVADHSNNALKKIPYSGGSYGTPVTLGGGFSSPTGVAVDGAGNVYVADYGHSAIKKVPYSGGSYGTPVTLGSGFSAPFGVAMDGAGNIYVADTYNSAVKKIELSVDFGAANVGASASSQTVAFSIDSTGTLGTPAVLTQGATGQDFTDAGTGTCTTNGINHSYSGGDTCTVVVSFNPMAPGTRTGAVVLLSSSGTALATAYLQGTGNGAQVTFPPGHAPGTLGSGLSYPTGVAVDGAGNVYVADYGHSAVKKVPYSGGSYGTPVALGSGFGNPYGVAVDGAGNVYVADYGNSDVEKISYSGGSYGTPVTLGSGFNQPYGVAVDGAGNVYVADTGNNAIKKVPYSGGSYGTPVTLGSGFYQSYGVAVDGAGNVYVAETGTSAVEKIPYSGGSYGTPVILGSGFSYPYGVAVDGAGNVYVADTDNNAIKKVPYSGGVYGTPVTLGSGFYQSHGVAVDGAGNVYVADFGNSAVKKIDLSDPPSLAFANAAVGDPSSDSPQTVTVFNDGNAALTFPAPASSGSYNPGLSNGNFVYSGSSTCNQIGSSSSAFSLAAGASCTEILSFSPVQPGSISGTLTSTDNNLNVPGSTQTITLAGTATAATGVMAQTITFPQPLTPATAGTSVTLTASSTSGLPILYTVISGPATLSGSTLTYSEAGTVVVEADQYGNDTYAAAAPVQDTVTVTEMANVGTTSGTLTALVTITTAGTANAIKVLTQGAPNLDFNFVSGGTCATSGSSSMYVVGATCTVEYAFSPSHPGPRLGGITLRNSSGAVLGSAYVSGTGFGPQVTYRPGTQITLASGFNKSYGVAVDGSGDVFVADYGNSAVKEIPYSGGIYGTPVVIGSGFHAPQGVAVDGSGNVFVADTFNNAVKVIPYSGGGYGTPVVIGSGFNAPFGVAVDGGGNVFVADSNNNAVKEIPYSGGSYGTPMALGSGFSRPSGVAVDGSGNVFVADTFNHVVKVIPYSGGSYGTPVVIASGFDPYGGAVDGSGNVFVADTANNVVKEIPYSGGSYGAPVVIGSGFNTPLGVLVDGSGNVFVGDTYNGRVEKLDFADAPSLTFASTSEGYVSSDSPQTVTIANDGNAPLTFPLPTSGNNPSLSLNFSLSGSSTCPQVTASSSMPASLAAGAVCTDILSFVPTTTGSISGQLVLTDNNLNASVSPGTIQTISLSGTGTTPPAPAVTGISPTYGPAVGGTSVTITGTSLTGASAVYFGATAATGFTINSDTSITATSPVGAGVVEVTVTTPGGTSATGPADEFSYQQTQTITFPQPVMPAVALSSVMLTATAGSGLPVTYTVVSGPATISDSTLTYSGTGTVVVEADQAGNAIYSAAPAVQDTVLVTATSNVGTPSSTLTAVVTITTAGMASAINVLTQGAVTAEFTFVSGGTCATSGNSSIYVLGATCTVAYVFTPSHPGTRLGGITLTNSSGVVLGTAYVSGTGVGPQITYLPGTRTTLASGFQELAGMAVDESGNLFVADTINNAVEELLYSGGHYGTPVILGSGFNLPRGTAVDGSGNVFVADVGSNSIKEIPYSAGSYGTPVILGSGFSSPSGVAADGSGNVFVADMGNRMVKEIPYSGGSYGTPVILASGFRNPFSMAVDGSGNIFVSDPTAHAVKEIPYSGGSYGAPVAIGSGVGFPVGLTVDANGNVFAADGDSNTVTEIPYRGGRYGAAVTVASGFDQPEGLAMDGSGNIFVADSDPNNSRVEKLDLADSAALTFASTNDGLTSSDSPQMITIQNDGNAALMFATPGTGTNPAISTGFAIDGSSTCPQLTAGKLDPNAVCTEVVNFAPSGQSGSVSGSLVNTDNDLNASNATQTILLAGTAVQLTPTVSVANFTMPYGFSSATLSATVTFTSGMTPTGAFSFTVDSGPSITATCSGSTSTTETCVANYPTSGFASAKSGSAIYTITGTLAADGNYVAASNTSTLTVTQDTPVVTVSSSSISYGAGSAALMATVTYSGSAAPSGVVSFTVNGSATDVGTVICTGSASPLTCTVSYNSSTLAAGSYGIAVSVAADTNYNTASGGGTLTVNKVTPTFGAMSFSPAAADPYGDDQIVTIRDTLAYTGAAAPSGAVTYLLNGVSYTANCSGSASPLPCTVSVPAATIAALSTNSYTVTAAYATDTNYTAATGGSGTFTISKATPAFGTMSFSPSATEPYGTSQAIILSDTLAFAGITAPSGAVTYTLSGVNYTASCSGSATPLTCTATVPAAPIADLPAIGYAVTAAYTADTNYTAATGSIGTFTISKETPTFGAMSFSPSAIEPYGTSQAIIVSDTLAYTGASAPGGAVTYLLNGVSYTANCSGTTTPLTCSASVPAATIAALPASGYTIAAAYTTDTNYTAATGTSGAFTISKAMPTFGAMSFSPSATEPYGTSHAIIISDTLAYTGTAAPGGAVTYTWNGVSYTAGCVGTASPLICTATVPEAAIVGLPATAYTVTAAYAADTNYTTATGSSGTFTIGQASQTVTFGPLISVAYGVSPITLSATGGASNNPVTFSITSGGSSGSLSETNNSVLTITGAGSITVTASQSGNANYAAATNVPQTLVINKANPIFGTMSFSPAATEPFGTSQVATISDTLTYAGGTAPSGAVTFTLNGVSYTASCSGAGTPLTCTANVPAAAIAALPATAYTVTAAYTADGNYVATTGTSGVLTINKTAQTLTGFTASPASPEAYGVGPITLSATGGASVNPVTFSLDASSTGTGSISGPILTVSGAGSFVIDVNQAGNANYTAAAQIQQTIVVNKATPAFGSMSFSPAVAEAYSTSQAITISDSLAYTGAAAPSGAVMYTLNGVSYTASCSGASTPLVCTATVPAASVAALPANGYTVTAVYTTDTNYAAITGTSGTFNIHQTSQTISFNALASPVTYGVSPFTLLATGGNSGNTVTFTIDASSTGNGSISGNMLTITGTGTLIIDANQAGNANYSAGTQVQRTIVVNQASQTINFTVPATPVAFGVSPIILSATGGSSGNTVTFTIDASSTGSGSISGNTLTITGAGNIVIDANQAGNANYSAATQVQRTIVVNQASQTISFSAPTSPVIFGVSPITLVATGGSSGNTVTFTINARSTATGSISGNILTVTGAGTLIIDANQSGNTSYSAATQVQRTMVVNQAAQTINFTAPTTPVIYGVSPIALSAAGGSSGNTVIFTIDASSTGTGNISGTMLTVNGVGTIVIDANQAGNANYSAATQVQRAVVVNQAAQSITFTAPTTPVIYGVSPITLSAIGGDSGNAVTFRITSGATLGSLGGTNNHTLTITGAGSIAIAASQAGNANYSAAADVSQTIVINQETPTFGAMSFSPAAAETYGTSQIITISDTLAYAGGTAPSGAVTYTLNGVGYAATCPGSSTPLICTANVPAVVIAALPATGYTVTAAYMADGNYTTTAGASGVFTINKTAQILTGFTASPASPEIYGVGAITLSATGGASGNPVTFSLDSSSTGTGNISGATLTVTGVGSLIVDVNQTGNPNYTAATQIQRTIVVNKATPAFGTMSFSPAAAEPFGTSQIVTINDTLAYTGSTAPSGTVTYTLNGVSYTASCSGTGIPLTCTANIPAAVVAALSPTGYIATAAYTADINYAATIGTNGTFTITQALQTINFIGPLTPVVYGVAPITLSATGGSSGNAVIFTIDASSTGSGSISGTTLTVTGAGTIVIDANQAGNANYSAATPVQRTIVVGRAAPAVTFTVPSHTYGDASFTVSSSSNSTGAFTYSVVSGPATISGSTVTLNGAGTVVLQASEAADANYTAATKDATFAVSGATPVITFLVPDHTYGDPPFTVSASSDSTGTFTYSVVSGLATISGSTVTLNGAGTVVLQASEAADANYTAATKNATFAVSAATPVIAFTVPNHTYGDVPFTVSATSNSTGSFTYAVVSGPATISGSTVKLTGVGTVTLRASEAANANYTANTKNATFTISAATPAITFTVPNHTYGDTPFTVSASSNSSGAFTYSVVSGLATISGSTVALTGAGTVVVRASEAGDANYTVATKDATFSTSVATPVITFSVPNHTYGDAPFTVSASSNSSGAFIYTVVSGPVMISGSTVTPTGVGAVVLQASEIADTNYAAGVTNATFNIFAATLTATANNATRYYGAANPGFTGSTTGAMYSDTFTESFTTTATTLSPPASYTITPTVAGPHLGDYAVATIDGVLTVTQAPTTASVKVSNTTLNPNQAVTLTAQINSTTSGTPTGSVTFNDNGSPTQTVALTSGGATYATVLSPGLAHAITVNYSGDTNFLSSASTASGVTITVAPLEFTVSTTAGSNAQTVAPGVAATYTFSISPNYTSYPGPVSFTVTGLPPGATATFSPSMIPANGGMQSVTMTIQTRAPFAHNTGGALGRGIPTMLALLLLPFAGSRKLRRKIGARLIMLALLLAGLVGGVAITGCGTGNGFLLEQPQTYTLTMTATSAGLQQTQTFTLIVQ